MKAYRIAGFCLDHMHIEALLASALASTSYEVVGVFDAEAARLDAVCDRLGISRAERFTDWERLVSEREPEVAFVCSTTAEHAVWCERLAQAGVHVILEKPFALSLAAAERAAAAAEEADVLLAVNWPLAWYPPHRTTRRLIAEGTLGNVLEVHYYDGNRGPTHHLPPDAGERDRWWFDPAAGGGSLLDYLGYGVTLATWFRDGELPGEVQATAYVPPDSSVDVQSVVVASYASGLSTFQTRWGTFSDPWIQQPHPRCGFVVVGSEGTIASRDYADSIALQTAEGESAIPVDDPTTSERDVLGAVAAALDAGAGVEGPCGVPISLAAQRIVDAAVESVCARRPVLLGTPAGAPA